MRNDTDIVFGNYFLECEMGFSHNWCHSVTSFVECEKWLSAVFTGYIQKTLLFQVLNEIQYLT
jgi:hypothetical protein